MTADPSTVGRTFGSGQKFELKRTCSRVLNYHQSFFRKSYCVPLSLLWSFIVFCLLQRCLASLFPFYLAVCNQQFWQQELILLSTSLCMKIKGMKRLFFELPVNEQYLLFPQLDFNLKEISRWKLSPSLPLKILS